MYGKKNQKLVRVVALLVALSMLLMTGIYIFSLTGWFGAELEQGGFVVRAATVGLTDSDRFRELEDFVDDLRFHYKDELPSDVLFQGLYKGLFDSLGDAWSVYYPSRETADKLIDSILGDYSGVGITMTMSDERVVITVVTPGGPADRAGIKSGDVIVRIDERSAAGLTLDEVALLVRGKEGTRVSLAVERGGTTKTYSMVREIIHAASVYPSVIEDDIGYIRITSFDSDTDKEFAQARLTLLNQGIRGLIIDLRDNGGGLMASALSIADQLVPFEGTLAHYERQGDIIETVSSSVNRTKQLPTAVLVNEYTASASECLAGALQDNGVARIIGRTTYGKGVAQMISQSPDGGAYKLSIYYFLTPHKRRIDGVGIAPDDVVHESGALSAEEVTAILRILAPMNEPVRYYAGQMGLNVYGAQQRLSYLGYEAPLTGIMDGDTVASIRKFQADEKLSLYGGLDYTTMAALSAAFEYYVLGEDVDLQLAAAIDWLK